MSDTIQWVVLELTPKAENEDPDSVRASIRHHIRDAEVFIPASVVQRGEQRVHHYLIDGYAFVKHQHPPAHYNRLIDTKYVQGPLYIPTGYKKDKRLATISDEQVDQLKKQIKVEVDQGIEVGDTIVITSGSYKNITAVVREEILEQDAVVVYIQLRSTDRLVTLPRAFLRFKSKPPYIVYKTTLKSMAAWTKMALYLAKWSNSGFSEIHQGSRNLGQLDKWLQRSRESYFSLRAYYTELDFDPLLRKFGEFQRLCEGISLREQIVFCADPLPILKPAIEKYQQVSFLSDACSRVVSIYTDVKKMTAPPSTNLIIDGTQLFIRCLSAPGLGSLTDSKGNPTGATTGFLRSLGAYKKRFPGARICVCWDGSSQRRKALYPEYKANRVAHTGGPSAEIGWLKDNLPLFGISQAFNPKEEADDVIAALVKGLFLDQTNIIVSTDRDLLQLVSEFTHQLCPNVGMSKEKLYNSDLVKSEYGVLPEFIVHIRALSGDSSDNIKGVPGFGLKTAAKLIRLYGTVPTLLASNLAGLGKPQISKLRVHEQQVLQNIDLLTLKDVSYTQIESNPDQKEAEAKLKELEIKPDSILAAFFPRQLTL